jgi:hypothetical protein
MSASHHGQKRRDRREVSTGRKVSEEDEKAPETGSPVPAELDENAWAAGKVEAGDFGGQTTELGTVGSEGQVDGAQQHEVLSQVVMENDLEKSTGIDYVGK